MIFQLMIVALAVLNTASSQSYGEEIDHHHNYKDHHHETHDHHEHHEQDYDEPHYKFEYQVEDKHTGDYKNHRESRKGHDVEGYYSVLEPDGTLREVHYTSGKHAGFNAVVTKSGKPIEQHDDDKTHHETHQHHFEPDHHHEHHEIHNHHEPITHHDFENHHEQKHHEPKFHNHKEMDHHHEVEHHHEPANHQQHDFSSFGDYESSNSPVPSKAKKLRRSHSKSPRFIRPYSVHENDKERRRSN